jgi:beta-glucosidase
MLDINMSDVMMVLGTISPYLIAFGVVLVAGIVVMVAVRGKQAALRKMIRSQSVLAILMVLVIVVNMICFGPMASMITLAMEDSGGGLSDATTVEATALAEEIMGDGIVLLKNEGNMLPIEAGRLNVFGWSSTNPCYGGTGSGSLSDTYEIVSLLQGLENAGFETNSELSDFYTAYRTERPDVGMWEQDWTLPEPAVDTYSDELLNNAKEFSDTAMIVFTRVGGEGSDLPEDMGVVTYENNSDDYLDFEDGEHYLQLSQTEENLVEMVCTNFDNVIIVYNGANAFELGFVDEYEQIKSVLWCPGAGQSGFNSLGRLLKGEINPSGKTVDTFVSDLSAAPTFNNFGNFEYDNMDEYAVPEEDAFAAGKTARFVNYVEGIYVGYRFYETAAAEGFLDFDEAVVYPFGYGLSYTSFKQEMGELSISGDGEISFDVTVTNTGDVAGKDVVEVYYNPPYTNGGIEKSAVNLIAFDKTKELAAGESETLTISFNAEDMASYDSKDAKGYVLEEGDYIISINTDSHHQIDSRTYNVESTVKYTDGNARSTDLVTATNQFDDVAGGVTFLSRADHFANYEEATAAPSSYSMPEEYKETFLNEVNYNPEDYNDPDDVAPTVDAKNGMTLAELRGADYDDERWETLLDNLTVEDMDKLIALAGYQTLSLDSVDKIRTIDCDGPASVNNEFTRVGSIGFPSTIVIAATWDHDLALKYGEMMGKMADEMNISGWYAPAVNTHRSAFSGRTFEYYSEDPVISGQLAAQAVIGAEEYGVYAYIKHYALNDQETNRYLMLCTWADEQAIREVYLKAFEICVKDGGAKAVMSSYNFIGNVPTGACPELLNTVLRDEWGFKGFVLTDYFGGCGYQDADRMIRNGNDAMLISYDMRTNHLDDTTSATSLLAMRQACKNIMYVVVNSRVYAGDNAQNGPLSWHKTAKAIDAVLVVLLIALEAVVIVRYKKRKKENII